MKTTAKCFARITPSNGQPSQVQELTAKTLIGAKRQARKIMIASCLPGGSVGVTYGDPRIGDVPSLFLIFR